MLTNKKVLGAKTEATQNAVATLADTDFIHAFDVEVNPNGDILEKPYVSASLDRYARAIGKRWYEFSFKTHLKASGTAGTAPPTGPLFLAAGFSETIVAVTSCTYNLLTAAPANFFGPSKSATLKIYEDGMLHILTGAIVDLKLILQAGQLAIAEWSGKALYTAVTDAAIPTNTPSAAVAKKIESATLQLQTYAAIAAKLEINLGNEITMLEDVNSVDGVKGFAVTGRNPGGSADPNAVLVATHDAYGKFLSGAEAAAQAVIGAGSAGNIITITAPKMQYGRITKGDRNGQLLFNVPFFLNRSSGDDSLVVAFT